MIVKPIPKSIVTAGTGIGAVRTRASRKAGMAAKTKAGDDSGQDDISSAIAEMWFWWKYGAARGWAIRMLGSYKDERDVGPCEIASCTFGGNLLLREYDLAAGVPKHTPYVLVQLEGHEGKWVGSIRGFYPLGQYEDGRRMHHNGNTTSVWIIPADELMPMRQLDHWITNNF